MEKTNLKNLKLMWVLKGLLASYIVTATMLIGISFLLYKFDVGEEFVRSGILVTYAMSAFTGGFILGKLMREKRYLWGFLMGCIYFLVLLVISMGVYRMIPEAADVAKGMLLCAAGGTVGGMIA